jgi:2-C-methyl-D-erythritol 4-phosphate cytidylyltransferase
VETISRDGLFRLQTPQAFRREVLAEAIARARSDGVVATDDSTLVERLGLPVRVVAGAEFNLKVTTSEDWSLAEEILKSLERSESASETSAEGAQV